MHHVFSEYTKENSPQSARVAHTGVPAAATYTKPAVPHVGVDVALPATASPQQPLQRHLQTHTSSHSPSRPMRPDVTGIPTVAAMTRAPVRSGYLAGLGKGYCTTARGAAQGYIGSNVLFKSLFRLIALPVRSPCSSCSIRAVDEEARVLTHTVCVLHSRPAFRIAPEHIYRETSSATNFSRLV